MSGIAKASIAATAVAAILFIAAAGYFWFGVRPSPEYSLALLVEEVHRGNDGAVEEFVDVQRVIDDFLPQVQRQAAELYGRGLPPSVLDQAAAAAAPLKPALAEKVRTGMPRYIREKTLKFRGYPAALAALGIGRVAKVRVNGDEASVEMKLSDRSIELSMVRNGPRWKIVGIKDDSIARQAAEQIGRELVAAAIKGGVRQVAEKLGIEGVDGLLDGLGDLVR